jgi:predicted lipoprotein with Yx(FWY)xxD motif
MNLRLMGAIALAGIALAACSTGTAGKSASSPPAYTPPIASMPVAAAEVSLETTSLGSILADGQGNTVYLFEKDTGKASQCYNACASAWPPLTTTNAAPIVGGGVDQAKLGTSARTDGTTQLTYAGHPLYRFTGDSKPGDTNGQGSQAFGAGWDALTARGQKIESN